MEFIKIADEEIRYIFTGLAADVFPNRRGIIAVARPAKLFSVLPDVFVGFLFVLAHDMADLVEQDRGTFGVVDRVREEIRIKRNYRERKIGCRIGIFFGYRGV